MEGPQLFYTRKTKYPKIEKNIDYQAINKLKFSRAAVILMMAKRLGGVFTKDEEYILNKKLGVPLDFDIQDGAKSYHSLSRLRSLVKSWKKENDQEFSQEEFQAILKEVSKGLENLERRLPWVKEAPEDKEGFKLPAEDVVGVGDRPGANVPEGKEGKLYVTWTQDPEPLPSFTSYMHDGAGKLVGGRTIVDCGASYSILTQAAFDELGLSEKLLDKSMRCQVKTAAGLLNSSGIYHSFIFMKAEDGKFYKSPISWLILQSNSLKYRIFGLPTMRNAEYKLGFTRKLGKENIKLNVLTSGNKEIVKSFSTYKVTDNKSPEVNNFYLKRVLNKTKGIKTLEFEAQNVEVGNYLIQCYDGKDAMVGPSQFLPQENFVEEVVINKQEEEGLWWPVATRQRVEVFVPTRRVGEELGAFRLEGVLAQDTEKYDSDLLYSQAMERVEKQSREDERRLEEEGFESLDDTTEAEDWLERRTTVVQNDEPLAPGEKYWMPDLSGIADNFVREKFSQLFDSYRDCFSKDSFSVRPSKVPLINLRINKEKLKDYQPAQPRAYQSEICEIISNFLKKMEAAGYIQDVTHQPEKHSEFNHAVFVVMKKSGFQEVLPSKMKPMSYQEKIEHLSKKARLVSDFRNCNEIIDAIPASPYPKFDDAVKLFGHSQASNVDLTSCYYGMKFDEASKPFTQFSFLERVYQYNSLTMGLKSAGFFCNTNLGLCFNRESFENFMKSQEDPVIQNTNYFKSFSRYLDDCSLLAPVRSKYNGYYILFYIWSWFLAVCREYHLTLGAKKITLGARYINLLGFNIDLEKNSYSLAPERVRAFQALPFPTNHQELRTLLATVAYFDRAMIASRQLIVFLAILGNDLSSYEFTATHYREWVMLKFSFTLNLSVMIINDDLPLFIATDASLTTMSAVAFQLDEAGVRGVPAVSNRAEDQVDPSAPSLNKQFRLCGVMSKTFGKEMVCHSILSKEMTSLTMGIKHFLNEIYTNRIQTIIFVDSRGLSLTAKLRTTNSKYFALNQLISSLPRTSLIHCIGGTFNAYSDTLSRLHNELSVDKSLIQEKYLDSPHEGFAEGLVVSPAMVKYFCNVDLPQIYLSAPKRKQISPHRSLKDLADMFNNRTITEAEILRGLFGGYGSINRDSVIFKNTVTDKLMSKSDFEKIVNVGGHQEVKQYLLLVQRGGECPQHKLHTLRFLQSLDKHLRVEEQDGELSGGEELAGEVQRLLRNHPDYSMEEFMRIYEQARNIGWSEMSGPDKPVTMATFCQVLQGNDSEVVLSTERNNLILRLRREVNVSAGEATRIVVNINVICPEVMKIKHKSNNVFGVFLSQKRGAENVALLTALIIGARYQGTIVPADTAIARIEVHTVDPCACDGKHHRHRVVFVLEQLESFPVSETEGAALLFTDVISKDIKGLSRAEAASMEDHEENIDDNGNEADVDRFKNFKAVYEEHTKITEGVFRNRMILLAALMGNKNTMTKPGFVQNWQNSDPAIRDLKRSVQQGRTSKFKINNNLLYRKESGVSFSFYQLVIPDTGIKLIADNQHIKGSHFSTRNMEILIHQYFWSPKSKEMIKQSKQGCSICLFNTKCTRVQYTQQDLMRNIQLASVYEFDYMEDLPKSEKGNKYLGVLRERVSGYIILAPTPSTSTEDTICALEPIFRSVGTPEFLMFDYGPGLRSQKFLDFLKSLSIIPRHQAPRRSRALGGVESSHKQTRACLTSYMATWNIADTQWDQCITAVNEILNSCIINYKNNTFSRRFLFFGAFRYQRPENLCKPDVEEQALEGARVQELARLVRSREEFARRYKVLPPSVFPIHSYVIVPRSKEERAVAHGSSGVALTVNKIYQVIQHNANSIRLRCINDGSEVTKQIGELQHIPMSYMHYIRRKTPLMTKSIFEDNIFKRGSEQKPLFEDLEKTEAAAEPEEGNQMDEELKSPELVEDEAPEELPVEPGEADQPDGEEYQSPEQVRRSTDRYSLRPRPRRNFSHLLLTQVLLPINNKFSPPMRKITRKSSLWNDGEPRGDLKFCFDSHNIVYEYCPTEAIVNEKNQHIYKKVYFKKVAEENFNNPACLNIFQAFNHDSGREIANIQRKREVRHFKISRVVREEKQDSTTRDVHHMVPSVCIIDGDV